MFNAFLEVLHDLWHFLLLSLRKTKGVKQKVSTVPFPEALVYDQVVGVDLGHQVYVSIPHLDCYVDVEMSGKNKLVTTFSYGDELKLLQESGSAALVSKGTYRCWAKNSGLTTNKEEVFPVFVANNTYRITDDQAVKVYRYLGIHFKRKEGKYLGSEAFVLYSLQRAGFIVPWEAINLIPEKTWYQRLIGKREIGIHNEPHTHSVLEYVTNEGVFKYGFVTAVYPDHTIQVESVGREHKGEYRIEELSRVAWEKWRPVFITFS